MVPSATGFRVSPPPQLSGTALLSCKGVMSPSHASYHSPRVLRAAGLVRASNGRGVGSGRDVARAPPIKRKCRPSIVTNLLSFVRCESSLPAFPPSPPRRDSLIRHRQQLLSGAAGPSATGCCGHGAHLRVGDEEADLSGGKRTRLRRYQLPFTGRPRGMLLRHASNGSPCNTRV